MKRNADFRIDPGAVPAGAVRIPGDKSVTHRAFILGAMADGAAS